jgi:hypothetical protein
MINSKPLKDAVAVIDGWENIYFIILLTITLLLANLIGLALFI